MNNKNWSVELEFTTFVENIEAETEDDAIKQALSKVMSNHHINGAINTILNRFENKSYAEVIEDENDAELLSV